MLLALWAKVKTAGYLPNMNTSARLAKIDEYGKN